MYNWPDYGIENVGISPLAQVVIPLCIAIAFAVFAGFYISATIGGRRHLYEDNPIRMLLGMSDQKTSQPVSAPPVVCVIETPAYQHAYRSLLELNFTRIESRLALEKAVGEGADVGDTESLIRCALSELERC